MSTFELDRRFTKLQQRIDKILLKLTDLQKDIQFVAKIARDNERQIRLIKNAIRNDESRSDSEPSASDDSTMQG